MSEFGKDGSGSVQPFPQWHALMSSVYVYVIVYDDRGHFHPMIITTPRQLLLFPMHVFLFTFWRFSILVYKTWKQIRSSSAFQRFLLLQNKSL